MDVFGCLSVPILPIPPKYLAFTNSVMRFSHDSNLSGLLTHMLKHFLIWLRFRENIRMCKSLRDIIDTLVQKIQFVFKTFYQ